MSWALEYFAVIDAALELIALTRPDSILDVGCGDGRVTAAVHDQFDADIVGVDLVEQAIAFAQVFNRDRPRAQFVCGDVADLEGLFDVALLIEVLEHVPEHALPELLEHVADRLHAHGTLVVSVPTTRRAVDAKHERHYDLELLRQHLLPTFAIDSIRYVHREGLLSRSIERLIANRVFALRLRQLLDLLHTVYEHQVAAADASSGAHLLVTCTRVH